MPAEFGAVTFGKTAPAGYLQESSEEDTVETVTIRNEDGHTVIFQPKPRQVTTTNLKCKGEATLGAVASAGNQFSGATVTSAKVTQSNDDFSTSEFTYTTHT
jgi:hypothetical protein